MKFCKDCKHCIVDEADKVYQYARCNVVRTKSKDYLVNGIEGLSFCGTEREWGEACGKEGKLFEAKDETVPA